jgi:regulator of protease activity HflC (stomatin/prohibitin superfamily)
MNIVRIGATAAFVFAATVGVGMAGCPRYNVYSSRLDGEAKLAEAEYSRQIAVREAVAERDSAKMHAQAEVERARGVAAANHIIGDSLNGKEDYLRYLYINNLKNTRNQVIYVPTEAGLPVLEAGKRP